ncbi:tail protein X [Neisseriaceae bacterium B1]
MQTNQIISKDGDTLSRIAYQYYGNSVAQVERILEANPQLCRYPALLPAGIAITLPAQTAQQATISTLNLWD